MNQFYNVEAIEKYKAKYPLPNEIKDLFEESQTLENLIHKVSKKSFKYRQLKRLVEKQTIILNKAWRMFRTLYPKLTNKQLTYVTDYEVIMPSNEVYIETEVCIDNEAPN